MDMKNGQESLPAEAQELMQRFQDRSARVAVVGLGYVGLPLAVLLAEAGLDVVGIDSDPEKVLKLESGKSYVEDIQDEQVGAVIDSGKLVVSSEYTLIQEVDGVSLCVPTPLRKTGDPDLSYIINATSQILPYLHSPMVVILESTTYPGTTREMMMPEIEEAGLVVGEEIFLAFSPERVDPGRKDFTTRNTPKVIGGISPACTQVAASMYGVAIEAIYPVSSTEVAEMTKLLENTFRAVNIALVNEMALMCDRLNVDVWEVIEAAASKPFGFMKFTPGPGLGGHCIPIDPLYLSWKLKSVKYNARFIELASEINTGMPRYVVQRIQDLFNTKGMSLKGSRILIIGVAYKPDVSDIRESPALDVIGLLKEKGAHVEYYDPYVDVIEHEGWEMKSVADLLGAASSVDCVVIVTNHRDIDYDALYERSKLIFDSRNALSDHRDLAGKLERL
jgi:UDP-N-acetyl-D-glucosamine dehydrogenase